MGNIVKGFVGSYLVISEEMATSMGVPLNCSCNLNVQRTDDGGYLIHKVESRREKIKNWMDKMYKHYLRIDMGENLVILDYIFTNNDAQINSFCYIIKKKDGTMYVAENTHFSIDTNSDAYRTFGYNLTNLCAFALAVKEDIPSEIYSDFND